MNKEKMILLDSYIKSGISPILLEDIPVNAFPDAIVIESNCDISVLNGHYEGQNFIAPDWYNQLINKKESVRTILIVNNLNKVSEEEQTKFIELFKYRKISTFELQDNCIIIATCNNLKESKINEEVYSLMVHI